MKLSIVIPAYNEARTIDAILQKVHAVRLGTVEKEIIVVDDASQDETPQILDRWSSTVQIIQHKHNQGKGAAVRTGFEHATGQILLIQDADLEYDPEDYMAIIRPILDGKADVVMGSRFLHEKPHFFTKDGDPFFAHYIGNLAIIWLTNFLYGFHATDYEGCYKAFSRDIIAEIPVRANGFAYDNELICKILRRKKRVVEVPIRYNPRPYLEGKKITWRSGMQMLWAIVQWRIRPF